MEKLVYCLSSDIEPDSLREALVGPVANRIMAAGDIAELEVYVADQQGALAAGLQSNMDPDGFMSASVSVWLRTLDTRFHIEEALLQVSDRIAGYSVTESVPREYQARSWFDGVVSPTVTLATAFSAKPGLDDSAFFSSWHGSHTRLSLRIHPLTRYVRNTVSRVLTAGAPPYQAMVFESVLSLEVLADVDQFYGGEQNRQEAIADLCSFADVHTMASMPMSETIVRAAPWRSVS